MGSTNVSPSLRHTHVGRRATWTVPPKRPLTAPWRLRAISQCQRFRWRRRRGRRSRSSSPSCLTYGAAWLASLVRRQTVLRGIDAESLWDQPRLGLRPRRAIVATASMPLLARHGRNRWALAVAVEFRFGSPQRGLGTHVCDLDAGFSCGGDPCTVGSAQHDGSRGCLHHAQWRGGLAPVVRTAATQVDGHRPESPEHHREVL